MSTPMHEPKSVTINGKVFEIGPMGPFKASFVNAHLVAIFGPLMLGQAEAVSRTLLSLPEEKQNYLFQTLFNGVRYMVPNGEPLELQHVASIEKAFACDLEGMYQLGFEVLEYEQFPFFKQAREKMGKLLELKDKMAQALSAQALAALDQSIGSETNETDGSESPTRKGAKTPKS